MRKFIRAAVVLTMVLCLSVTAFAAPGADTSPTQECEIDMASVKGPNGEHVDIEISDPTEHFDFEEQGDTIDFGDGKEVNAAALSVVFEKDITSDVLPVTITFNVAGAGSNDILHVMHYNGSEWEQVAEGRGNSVTATFTSLSPVAVILEHPSGAHTAVGTSPKTGEQPVLLAAAAVALLAGAVAAAALKKREEN